MGPRGSGLDPLAKMECRIGIKKGKLHISKKQNQTKQPALCETEGDRDRKNRHLLVFTEHLFYARCVETTRDRVKQTEKKAAKDNERDVEK